jgi:Zn-dependent protease with chaperone function
MVQVLLILLYGSIYLHDGLREAPGGDPSTNPLKVAATTLAGFVAIWLALHLVAAWCGSQIDKTGRVRWIQTAERWLTLSRIAGACWWTYCLFDLGWLGAVRTKVGDLWLIDELLAMSPFIALLVGGWWSLYPVERRFHEALLIRQLDNPDAQPIHPILSRSEQVWMSARHQLLLWMVPLTLLMGWQELLSFQAKPLIRVLGGIAPRHGGDLLEAVRLIGTFLIIIVTPALMRFVWDTVRIGPGPLADQVHAMCRRYRVRVGGPLLWRTRGTMVNGAILGVFYPLRFMLLTDALLERLGPAQVEAVMAHEVAHVRRRHLIWLAVCIVSTVIVAAWCLTGALWALHIVTHAIPSETTVSVASTLIGLAGAGMVFGLVSRRFEWQADAFAVQHLSTTQGPSDHQQARVTPEAVTTMASALQSVADLNGIAANKPSWRHGSIRQRQERLRRLVNVPIAATPIDRQVLVIKLVASIALALGVASMFIPSLLSQPS